MQFWASYSLNNQVWGWSNEQPLFRLLLASLIFGDSCSKCLLSFPLLAPSSSISPKPFAWHRAALREDFKCKCQHLTLPGSLILCQVIWRAACQEGNTVQRLCVCLWQWEWGWCSSFCFCTKNGHFNKVWYWNATWVYHQRSCTKAAKRKSKRDDKSFLTHIRSIYVYEMLFDISLTNNAAFIPTKDPENVFSA